MRPPASNALDWTERILQFPVRTAAVDDFLRDLRAKGAADLNAVMATFNDGSLCREAQAYWVERGWVVVSPSTPLHALAGPQFTREVSLRSFCGEPEGQNAPEPPRPEETEANVDS